MKTDNKAKWAAKLILDKSRRCEVELVSADKVYVREMDGETPISRTETTERNLLIAILSELTS